MLEWNFDDNIFQACLEINAVLLLVGSGFFDLNFIYFFRLENKISSVKTSGIFYFKLGVDNYFPPRATLRLLKKVSRAKF